MKAVVLREQNPLEHNSLDIEEYPRPEPNAHEIRLAISYCGACRTDLHIIEGELPAHKLPVIIGHQIVGRVDKIGDKVTTWKIGQRAGIPWLNSTCGTCKYCHRGQENICDHAQFTGYDVDGGFAEFVIVHEDFAYTLPDAYSDEQVAPLLCAGVIGYQAFQATGLTHTAKLGLFGFGSSAHIILQVARHLGHEVYVVSRTKTELALAKKLGAHWIGRIDEPMGTKLDAGIVFAPSGELIVNALSCLDKGGRLVSAGIYASALPGFDYSLLWPEKSLTAIANTSRKNVRAFLDIAKRCTIHTKTTIYPLHEIRNAFLNIKHSRVSGSTIIKIQ